MGADSCDYFPTADSWLRVGEFLELWQLLSPYLQVNGAIFYDDFDNAGHQQFESRGIPKRMLCPDGVDSYLNHSGKVRELNLFEARPSRFGVTTLCRSTAIRPRPRFREHSPGGAWADCRRRGAFSL